ncbi:MAG: sulfate ABC transporter substrate-binding protein [Anaerolineae bacterium]|nr:sulfate ABC transporter substrate-binding protein [Gemmatimonadaceae bacterium]
MIAFADIRNAAFALSLTALAACGGETEASNQAGSPPPVRSLTLGAYTTPREVYGQKILPGFAKQWKEKTGEDVKFAESYLGSGAQSRAIIDGFEADVAALSLEPDITKIADAKLITRERKDAPNGGMVSRSVVVIGVRPGNPKNIRGWDDLTRKGVEVLTPNPKTSGGAMWNIVALYGAALRGGTRATAGDSAAAEAILAAVVRNVRIMDKGARESMLTFESGVGDAIITYENEALVARKAGKAMDYVIPTSTVLIENPVAVVDVYAEKHGNGDLAQAFVDYLSSPEAQRHYAEYGLRAVDESVAKETAGTYPPVKDLFTIRDLGGWPQVTKTLFDRGGVFERATSRKMVAAR